MRQPEQAAYLIVDSAHLEEQRMSLCPLIDGWETVEEMESDLGIPTGALVRTMDRYNEHAARGEDPDFQRHKVGLMAPGMVAPIEAAPFYAVPMYPGMLGTNGGPQINADAQVRRRGGGVIGGLYAAGNTAANVFGWAYPSGGGTLGNGLVFGFRAGRHVGAQPARDV
jgi:succinate dehydrogenase/fumarate reductase flavoprotein subunit